MKKKLVLVGLLSFTVLFGCSQVSTEVKAGVGKSFIEVGESKIDGRDIIKFKDIESGCYWILSNVAQGTDIEQMMIEKNGVTVPYCEK